MKLLFKNWAINTMTIAELIHKLQQYPQEMPVAFTWEEQIKPVEYNSFSIESVNLNLVCPILLIDANPF